MATRKGKEGHGRRGFLFVRARALFLAGKLIFYFLVGFLHFFYTDRKFFVSSSVVFLLTVGVINETKRKGL